jgi:hypothetical protein
VRGACRGVVVGGESSFIEGVRSTAPMSPAAARNVKNPRLGVAA